MIKIYSIHFNRPDFVRIQLDSFKRFIKNDFKFFVINNSGSNDIDIECKKNNIECINLNNKDMGPSKSHSEGLKELKKYIKNDDSIHVILDHDVFIVKEIDLIEYMEDYSIMYLPQDKDGLHYMWPGLVIINSLLCPNLQNLGFSLGFYNGVNLDTGGESYKYLLDNPKIKIKEIQETAIHENDNLNEFSFLYNDTFLHYFRGSNWVKMDQDILSRKNNKLNKFIYEQDKS